MDSSPERAQPTSGRARRALRRPRKSRIVSEAMRLTAVGELLIRTRCWRGVLVLNHHRIGDGSQSPVNRRLWSATQAAFEQQMRLVRRRFEVISPDELSPASLSRPGRRVMVTFDDGYRDLYELAAPILEATDVRATMFLCSGFIDGDADAWWDEIAWMLRDSPNPTLPAGPWSAAARPLRGPGLEETIDVLNEFYATLGPGETGGFLERLATAAGSRRRPSANVSDWITWDMARALRDAGHSIGAHTVTHPVLSTLPIPQQEAEILGSMDRIEAELGQRPRWLAYPVGASSAFTAETGDCARRAGIELAFSNYGGVVTDSTFEAFDVRRISLGPLFDASVFHATLALPQLFARAEG